MAKIDGMKMIAHVDVNMDDFNKKMKKIAEAFDSLGPILIELANSLNTLAVDMHKFYHSCVELGLVED